jgi:formyl-CoA transferase
MGLGHDALHDLNRRLVYCSVSGYGRTGPYADRPGYDFIIQAEGGMMGITGPEEGAPYRVGIPIVDIATGMFATTAILAALRARDVTGEGQEVDMSLLDSQVALLTNVASNYLVGGQPPSRLGNSHPNIMPYEAFRARDKWFAMAAGNERQWAILCDVLDRPDLRDDLRFADNSQRLVNRAALREELETTFVTRDAEEWLAELREAGLPCGPINSVPEVFQHPQVEARELVVEAQHPTAGTVRFPGFPYKFSHTPAAVRLPPPRLGEHTETVLVNLLHYKQEEVAALRGHEII